MPHRPNFRLPSRQRLTILALHVQDGFLVLERPDGIVPLYRFTPLRLSQQCGQHVPFASQWPEHLKPYIYLFTPLPSVPAEALPPQLAPEFGVQPRPPGGLRAYPHTTYRGWPLYVYSHDHPAQAPQGEVQGLFERVTSDLTPVAADPKGRGFGP